MATFERIGLQNNKNNYDRIVKYLRIKSKIKKKYFPF